MISMMRKREAADLSFTRMENRSTKNEVFGNVKALLKPKVVNKRFVRCSRSKSVSIIPHYNVSDVLFCNFKIDFTTFHEQKKSARLLRFSHQVVVKKEIKQELFLEKIFNNTASKSCKQKKNKNNNPLNFQLSIIFYSTKLTVKLTNVVTAWHFNLIYRAGDVEKNPGPKKDNILKVITYNERGLKEYKKLKRVLNKCAGIIGSNHNTVINLQETHLESNEENRIKLLWRGNFILSPGSQKSRGCLTLFDTSWELLEEWADPGGRSCVITIKKAAGVFTITNLYAPNIHNVTFFEAVILRQIEYKDKYNSNSVILGDFNLCLDPKIDSINRKQSDNEKIVAVFLNESFRATNLSDVYRVKHNSGGFTWNRGRCFSRLDMIIASEELTNNIITTKVDWAFDKSDHAAVLAEFTLNNGTHRGPGLPRVDSSFLSDQYIKQEFKTMLSESVMSIPDTWDPNVKWEFIKVSIRSIAWELKSKNKKLGNSEDEAVRNQLNTLKYNKATMLANKLLTSESEAELDCDIAHFESILHQKLEEKSKDLASKAKVKWFNEGEKSNKYFLNIIKKKQQQSTITFITDGIKTASEQKDIESLATDFYSTLYKKDNNLTQDFDSFYDPETPTISEEDRSYLDNDITLEELKKTVNSCKESAPGPDGIPYGIYKQFWEVLGPYSLESWKFSCAKGILPDSQRCSSITLLPKEGKDLSNIGNWRPITLTNCDLKIYTKLISNRVSKVLDKIIHPSQTAYIPGRNVHDNLRMFEFYRKYCEDNNIDAVLMSMDAKKAFDSVDHNYMFTTLKKYGFSDKFINLVKLLYNDIKADIVINGYRTKKIKIGRCVKQGDALSCALYIIGADPLLRNINRNPLILEIRIFTPLTNRRVKNKTGAFADDVGTLVRNDPESINEIFKEYKKFSERSGIMLNETKTEIMELGGGRGDGGHFVPKFFSVTLPGNTFRLKSVESITICGVTFSNNRDLAYKNNVSDKLDKLKDKLLAWQFRGLSLGGKITIVKTFGVSQLIYTMQACHYAASDVERIEAFVFKFLWSKNCNISLAPDRISRTTMKQNYEMGGLKVPDLKNLDYALKLKQFIRANNSNHPIRNIQKWQMEHLDYDDPLQQEYSRICIMDPVIAGAQLCINKITDIMRSEIGSLATCPSYKIDLIASTDVLEYLKRKDLPLIQTWYMQLFRCGIENLKQLITESMFPRSDRFHRLSLNTLSAFPSIWITKITENWECQSEVNLGDNLSLSVDKPVKCTSLTVASIRNRILQKSNTPFKFVSKLGIVQHENINPFIVAREVNQSIAQKIFKFRLLHLDIFCNERMFKFKMVQSKNCDRCGCVESIRHVLWECVRASRVWDYLNNILTVQGYNITVSFDSLFVGFAPTNPVVECIITRLTQLLLQIERNNDFDLEFLKKILVSHVILNLQCKKIKMNRHLLAEWTKFKDYITDE